MYPSIRCYSQYSCHVHLSNFTICSWACHWLFQFKKYMSDIMAESKEFQWKNVDVKYQIFNFNLSQCISMLVINVGGLRCLTRCGEFRLDDWCFSYGHRFGSRYRVSSRQFGCSCRFKRASYSSGPLFRHLIISGIEKLLLKNVISMSLVKICRPVEKWNGILSRSILTPLASLFCKKAVCPPGPPALPSTADGNLAFNFASSIFSSSRG